MLTVVAYDIADVKRLRKVARHCEDWGVRVEKSVFECRLEPAQFQEFWDGLLERIDPDEDTLVSYKVCARCAGEIRSAGKFVGTEKVLAYWF